MKKPKLGRPKGSTNKPKVVKQAKGSVRGDNLPVDPEMKALFLQNKSKIERLTQNKDKAVSALRSAYKTAKSEGFTKAQFDYAMSLDTPEGEEKIRSDIANRLLVARWMGADIGTQLEMFLEPTRVPAVDRAYEEGQRASMENKPAKPGYDPSTEQYRRYMAGFHDHQATIAAGIKPAAEKPKAEKAAKPDKANKEAKADKANGAQKTPVQEATSGVPMTRAAFRKALQDQDKAADESIFKKKDAAEGGEGEPKPSAA